MYLGIHHWVYVVCGQDPSKCVQLGDFMKLSGISYSPSSSIAEECGLPPFTGVKVPSGMVICTFCAKAGKVGVAMLTPRLTSTTVVMKPRKFLSSDMSAEGKYMGNKVVHVADEITACPTHVGLIDHKNVVGQKWTTNSEG